MLRQSTLAAALALCSLPAMARDCTPIETAPGVRTKPAGCVNLGREAQPKKPEDSRLRGADGYIVNRDGTRIRVFGRAGVEVGTGSR
jgi:hypothetical protein